MSMVNDFLEWVGKDPEAAAKALGTFPSIVNRWLSGSHQPPLKFIEKWMEVKDQKAPSSPAVDPTSKAKAKKAATVKSVPVVKEEPCDGMASVIPPTEGEGESLGFKEPEPAPTAPVVELKSEWEGRNLMVLFPCYRFTNAATAWTLLALALDFGKEKIRFEMELGDAMIYHARNKLADKFLKSGCEWSLWIDDDVIAPIGRPQFFKFMGRLPPEYPEKAMGHHVVNRLLSHKKTIVGATYFGRHAGGPPMFADMHKPDAVRDARSFKDGIRQTEWVATGCLLVHRSVYLDIQKKFPNLAPSDDHPWQKEYDFFLPEPGQGEDVAFCKRAGAAGHQVFVDTGLQCLHVGFCSYHALNTGQMNTGMGF